MPTPSRDAQGLALPDEVDWQIHRIASSEYYSSSLIEIQTQWSLEDLLDATIVLDARAKLEERATKRHRTK